MTNSQKSFGGGMLRSLRLTNFKGYRDSGEISFAPLTVLVGCNNAGKSSIFHALLALHQTMRDLSPSVRLVTRGKFVDLGGFHDILHHGQQAKSRVSVSTFGFELSRDPMPSPVVHPGGKSFRIASKLNLSFGFAKSENKIVLSKLELADEQGVIASGDEKHFSFEGASKEVDKLLGFRLINFLPEPLLPEKKIKAPRKVLEELFDLFMNLGVLAQPWRSLLSGDLIHIAGLRSHIPFYGGVGAQTESESGPGGEELIRVLASDRLIRGETLLKSVNTWMDSKFKALSNIRLDTLDKSRHIRSLIADDPGGPKNVNIAAMGEGLSQLLPVVSTTLKAADHDCVLIEQPEIHLHPKLQAELADLFVEVVKIGNRQLIVETHSEHLLIRLRTLVAKKIIPAEDVAIIYVEKEDGSSRARRLDMNEKGHFDDWPEGFFDESYREAMALAMAQPIMTPKHE